MYPLVDEMAALRRGLLITLALVVLGAGAFGVWSYKRMAQQNAELQVQAERADSLQGQIDVIAQESVKRANTDTAVRKERAVITQRLEQAKANDPTAADFLGARIPDSVRRAYLGEAER